ncbi:hypothetical protein K443DRAFT_120425 [Laccaria amethystina LaAM-08-1]|uniref:Uncharacterized protein n=1 Tax=Laccaria amethystina LaAM-08-1 TaxID=1095629 RepID=A0A0C9XKT5_9AGAR|nr:hypothetical protein K443DRAFT_120425 [Laccaria amethystina LaAM-08-1]
MSRREALRIEERFGKWEHNKRSLLNWHEFQIERFEIWNTAYLVVDDLSPGGGKRKTERHEPMRNPPLRPEMGLARNETAFRELEAEIDHINAATGKKRRSLQTQRTHPLFDLLPEIFVSIF